MIKAKNSSYEGDFVGGLKEGHATITQKNGSYTGSVKNGKFHGQGQYRWNDGKTYVGAYLMDLKDGYGVFYLVDGSRYEGYWKDGKQNGKGKVVTANGLE